MLISEIIVKGKMKAVHTDVPCRVKILDAGVENCKMQEEYDAYVESLSWQTGIIELTPPMLIPLRGIAQFIRDDSFISSAVSVADFEVVEKVASEEVDYSKEVAWIYQDEHANDVAIYMGDTVKMKIENDQYLTSDVRYAEDLKKYYLQGVTGRYFFFIGCEVEKIQEENANEN